MVSESPAPEGFAAPWLQVAHGRQAFALHRRTFTDTRQKIPLTGITGTNGKTTTSYLIDSMLRAAGNTTALVGTIEYHLADRSSAGGEHHAGIARPLCRILDELRRWAARTPTMEVSSHALDAGARLRASISTRRFSPTSHRIIWITTRRWSEYFAAKRCCSMASTVRRPPRFAVINADDEYGPQARGSARRTQVAPLRARQ